MLFTSMIALSNTLHFAGKGDLNQRNQKLEKAGDRQIGDEAFLSRRDEWVKRKRPREHGGGKDEGYVTTPGHSSDEDSDGEKRPSARRRARLEGKEFDSFSQMFRDLSTPEQKARAEKKGDLGHAIPSDAKRIK